MTHVPSGRVYIGQRKCPAKKTPETDKYFGSGVVWKGIYNAHPDECKKEILHVCETRDEVIELEKEYIKRAREQYGVLCVNVSDGGDGAIVGGHHPNFGKKFSDETVKKMSEAHKGIPSWNKGKHGIFSQDTLKKMSDAHKGRTPWNKGKKYTEEQKQAFKGRTPWNKGVPRTEDEKRKMSEAKKGK